MTARKRKELLIKLIEDERDPAVLELIDNVLQRRTKGMAFNSEMVARVVRSEEDLKKGRFKGLEETMKEMDAFIDDLYPKKNTRRK